MNKKTILISGAVIVLIAIFLRLEPGYPALSAILVGGSIVFWLYYIAYYAQADEGEDFMGSLFNFGVLRSKDDFAGKKTDIELQSDVMDELEWDPKVQSSEIGVAVSEGVVTLSGSVDSYWEKLAAEKAVKRVAGVAGIAEDIVVKIKYDNARTDTEIAQSAISALKWNDVIPQNTVRVKVEDGWITLEGDVEWRYQKHQAEKAVENMYGVKGLSNLINVKPRVKSRLVKSSIKQALHRSAEVEASQIDISIEGGVVTLTGWVRSWLERREVIKAAWNAPGVTRVDDQLKMGWVR